MNNNGWGLRKELLIILLFVICLIIGTIGLNRLGLLGYNPNSIIDSSQNADTFDYSALETQLLTAGKSYYENNYSSIDQDQTEYIITLSTLKGTGYISDIYDADARICTGYVKIVKSEDGNVYLSYIKCPDYETYGYERSFDS